MNSISSLSNPLVKRTLLLQQKSQERRRAGLIVVEGRREVTLALGAGMEAESVMLCPAICGDWMPEGVAGQRLTEVTPQVYARMAYREGTEGVIAVMRPRPSSLQDLRLPPNPLLLVLEGVEKPGNVGAILRTADAAGVDAVVMCDCPTDIWNPNLIRASLGSVFTVPCVETTSAQCIAFLQGIGAGILTAQLQDSQLYYDQPMTGATAIVMGTEATGLTPQWRQAATAHIRIPMLGRLDSLNVSVAAAVLTYEAVRQRQTNK